MVFPYNGRTLVMLVVKLLVVLQLLSLLKPMCNVSVEHHGDFRRGGGKCFKIWASLNCHIKNLNFEYGMMEKQE